MQHQIVDNDNTEAKEETTDFLIYLLQTNSTSQSK